MKKYPSVRRLPKFEYVAPQTLKEAVAFLSKHQKAATPLAGGTDLLLNMKRRAVVPQYLVALKNIPDLDAITYKKEQGLRIGALATIHAVETSPDVQRYYPILSQAAATLGSIQIRNLGTVVGNVCSALPSADMVPSLVALGARVKIINAAEEKLMPVEDFITNVGKTVLKSDELVGELQVPPPCPPVAAAPTSNMPREGPRPWEYAMWPPGSPWIRIIAPRPRSVSVPSGKPLSGQLKPSPFSREMRLPPIR